MGDWIERDKQHALRETREAIAVCRPDDAIEISALSLYQLAQTIVQQQREIESLLLDAEMRRRADAGHQRAADESSTMRFDLELMTLRNALAGIDDREWHADGCTLRTVDDRTYVAMANDRRTAVYVAMLDPKFVRRLVAEVDRQRITPANPV